ncbi:DUF2769 domain-containing protein [Methanosarcina sp. MTP4]|uniref:DUF2769 domain-containing protein n=1 Tax=Methanosarcina sp. MTP4 TaxID=1434100 RepID=UPI000ADD34CC|nr:DUF2769 domain-containing protein [Methanosarcina sp. MTP4]
MERKSGKEEWKGRVEMGSERKKRILEKDPGKGPENYGKYFGVCFSYHNSKACICGSCPSYPGSGNMFCARGKSRLTDDMLPEKKDDCLCRDCELYRKFRFEGQYFCMGE